MIKFRQNSMYRMNLDKGNLEQNGKDIECKLEQVAEW